MAEIVIHVENLAKSFDKNVIFDTCSVSIEKGTVFGLVGLNGSGKTTFIRLLLGLLKPGAGSISVLGCEPWRHDPAYFRKLGVILDHDGFAGNMTIAENLFTFAEAKGLDKGKVRAYVTEYWNNTFLGEEFFGKGKRVKYLSRGQKMQCAICRAFLSWPAVYFLDEPTVALDVNAIDHFYSLVNHARARGGTLVISSHQISAIEDLCDCVGILHNKNVTMVKAGSGSLGSWVIRCQSDERFGTAIERFCGFQADYRDGAWHFPVRSEDAENVVPSIVSALASDGCKILEVGHETETLKDLIRKSRSGSAL